MPNKKLTLTIVILALILALSASVVAAQEDDTFRPPDIYKNADTKTLALGDTVQFTITVINPNNPVDGTTWYNVRVTDNVDRALRIDAASSTMGTATINGQQVVVNGGITLPPGGQFVITIDCTLVGPIVSDILYNTATLEYTDSDGNPQDPQEVDDPVEVIIEEKPPVVPEASTLILMGSAASGLIGYAGLQIRARKRKGS